jgi:hypothetical protein
MLYTDYILYAALIVFVLYITKLNNFWGVGKGTKKVKADVKLEKSKQKKRKRNLFLLEKYVWISNNVGFSLNEFKEKDYKYKIDRLHWEIKVLSRNIRPSELAGIMKLIQLVACLVGVTGLVATGSIFFLATGLFLFTPAIFNLYATTRISDEDDKLESEFPDLYLILYSRLVQGAHARLAPTLKDFLMSIDSIEGKDKAKLVIKNFALDLRNNIEIYGDDGMAVRKLTEKYRSVMVINFCNLTVQALNGVNNSDKLLSFKLELNSKRIEQMKNRADKLVKRGSRSVIVIYVILFQFLVISWVAKLSQAGGVGKIFGL